MCPSGAAAAGWQRRPAPLPIAPRTVTSHHNAGAKVICSMSRCVEAAAGAIHQSSAGQITDRPSPARCSSDSQINRPDTSNDSAWEEKTRPRKRKHMWPFKNGGGPRSRQASETITPQPVMPTTNTAPNWGVCLKGWIVSLRQPFDFPLKM